MSYYAQYGVLTYRLEEAKRKRDANFHRRLPILRNMMYAWDSFAVYNAKLALDNRIGNQMIGEYFRSFGRR